MSPFLPQARSPGESSGSRKLPKYFTYSEIKKLLSHRLKTDDPNAYYLTTFLWRTGVRVSEALAVKVGDINFVDHSIRILTLKRKDGHVRYIPFNGEFSGLTLAWIQKHNLVATDKLFSISRKTAYNWIATACIKAGINDGRAHPQTLRHSFAVNLLSQNFPTSILKELLGHATLSQTLIYTQLVDTDPLKLFKGLKF
ncbi:MAG: putative integrase [Firmicutes bacterium]|nr:putative integrase [Bacillota bacterium]